VFFHGADYSGVFFVEQRYDSVNSFEILVRRDSAQGGWEKKRGVSDLFKVSSSIPVGWGYCVVKAGLDRRRLPEGSVDSPRGRIGE
jgi:hypothetical protein